MIDILKLRAHHIICLPAAQWHFQERGPEYLQLDNRIKEILLSGSGQAIMVIEGTDNLCKLCDVYQDGRCASPQGSEEQVLKWDASLLRSLGVTTGTCLTAGEWQALVKQKAPFRVCFKCQWRQDCSIGVKAR